MWGLICIYQYLYISIYVCLVIVIIYLSEYLVQVFLKFWSIRFRISRRTELIIFVGCAFKGATLLYFSRDMISIFLKICFRNETGFLWSCWALHVGWVSFYRIALIKWKEFTVYVFSFMFHFYITHIIKNGCIFLCFIDIFLFWDYKNRIPQMRQRTSVSVMEYFEQNEHLSEGQWTSLRRAMFVLLYVLYNLFIIY